MLEWLVLQKSCEGCCGCSSKQIRLADALGQVMNQMKRDDALYAAFLAFSLRQINAVCFENGVINVNTIQSLDWKLMRIKS